MKQRLGFIWTCLGVPVAILAAVSGSGSPAFSGEETKPWQVFIARDLDGKREAFIALRPNVTQPVFLYLKNTGLNDRTDVKVMLVRLDSRGKKRILSGEIKKIVPDEQIRVEFKPSPPPAKEEVQVESPPYLFQLWVDEEGKETKKLKLPVTVMQPYQYMLKAPKAEFDKTKKNLLSVQLEIKPDWAEPPCPVKLDFSPELKPPTRGNLKGKLYLKNPKVDSNLETELSAVDLQFKTDSPKKGRIYVTVDGYERAFMYPITFDQGVLKQLSVGTRIRLKAPRYFNPQSEDKAAPKGAVKTSPKLWVNLEADGTEIAGQRIEVALYRGNGKYETKDLLPGLREQIVSVGVGPKGNPHFTTLVRDWKVPIDPDEIPEGRQKLRVRVLEADQTAVELADETVGKDEAVFLFSEDPKKNPYAPLTYDGPNKAVYAEIVIDSTGPADLQFVDLPKAWPGAKIWLKAKATRDDQVQAPISKVQFFVGDATKEPGHEGVLKGDLWQAEIAVPKDEKKEKLAVEVRATTAAGVTASKTEEITLQSAPLGDKSKITGVVKWNDKLQPDRPVKLLDGKKKEVMKGKTDEKGVYVFLNVPPGKYQVSARIPGMFQGTAAAAVTKEHGEVIKADITLKRIP